MLEENQCFHAESAEGASEWRRQARQVAMEEEGECLRRNREGSQGVAQYAYINSYRHSHVRVIFNGGAKSRVDP